MVAVLGAGRTAAECSAWVANCGLKVLWGVPHPLDPSEARRQLTTRRHPLLYSPHLAASVRCASWQEFLAALPEAGWLIVCQEGPSETLAVQLLAVRTRLTSRQTMLVDSVAARLSSLLGSLADEALSRRTFGVRLYPDLTRARLVGLVSPSAASSDDRRLVAEFCDRALGKRVAWYPDEIGSGGWSIWVASLLLAVAVAERLQLPLEVADHLTARLGFAREGAFTDTDRFGLDRLLRLADALSSAVPGWSVPIPGTLRLLVERGSTGASKGRGFYRTESPRERMPLDLVTHAYREPMADTEPCELGRLSLDGMRSLASLRTPEGEFARMWLGSTIRFAVRQRANSARTAWELDAALEDGFGWGIGPLRVAQALLPPDEAQEAPYLAPGKTRVFGGEWAAIVRPEGCEPLRELPVIEDLPACTLRQASTGMVVCLKSIPGRRLPSDAVRELTEAIAKLPAGAAFLAAPDGWPTYLDLPRLMELHAAGDRAAIEAELRAFDDLCLAVRRTIRASLVDGECLGAGLSIALSAPMAAVARGAAIGFPEARAGLPPVGLGPLLLAEDAFRRGGTELLALCHAVFRGETPWNAVLGRESGLLRSRDLLCVHPDRLAEAACGADPIQEEGWQPLCSGERFLAQALAQARQTAGFSAHDARIAQLIRAAWGQANTLEKGLERQRHAFAEALGLALTQARIRALLESGRPLRN